MIESDLARQLELYASLLRQAPYSSHVVVTDMDGSSIIKYGERMGLLMRHAHAMGDIIGMTEETPSNDLISQ